MSTDDLVTIKEAAKALMSTDDLVSIKEAAKAMGMGAGSLYRLAKAGKVPSYSAGPRLSGVRVSISEVKKALRRSARGEEE